MNLRGQSERPREDHHPGQRPQPHRAGHRVRLLLLPRRLCALEGRLRDHHGQLQPRDGFDGLRHLRPAVLRAADAGGRAGHHRDGERQRQAQGRDRAVRRADAAQARAGARCPGCAHSRHVAGCHRPGRGPRPLQGAGRQAQAPAAQERHRLLHRAGARWPPRRSASRLWCGRPTCLAAGPWRSFPIRPR